MKRQVWNFMKTVGGLPLMLALATSLCAPGPLNAQTQAHQRQQSSHDLSLLSLAAVQGRAEAGDAGAEVELGNRYLHGTDGVSLDYAQALVWFQKAAAQGNADAENGLGDVYHDGQGVQKDYSQALAWFQKAAAQGDATAKQNLAILRQQTANQQQATSQPEPEGSGSGGDCNSVLKANMQNNCHIPNNGSICDSARAMESCYEDAANAGANVCPESVISQYKKEAKAAAQTANSVCASGAC